MRDGGATPLAKKEQRPRTRAERRRIANFWIGLAAMCFLVGSGVWLKLSANRKVAAKEVSCLESFARGLRAGDPGAARDRLGEAGECYGDLLRAKPLFSAMGFRAQAAADIAAYLAEESNRATPAEALSNEDFRHAFDALAAGRLDEAFGGFRALEALPGSLGKLAGRYRALVGDLRRVRI